MVTELKGAWLNMLQSATLRAIFFVCACTAFISVIGHTVDNRLVLGAPVWLKPLKFSFSIMLMAYTLAFIQGYIQPNQKATGRLLTIFRIAAITLITEMVLIMVQAFRGVGSHFNAATILDNAIYSTMGISIGVFWIAMMFLMWMLFKANIGTRPMQMALRLGMIIGIIGMGMAWRMTSPTTEQIAAMKNGTWDYQVGTHTVGTETNDAHLPLLRWNQTAGDLRVPHFIGIHALQILPLLVLALAGLHVTEKKQLLIVYVLAALWAILTIATFVQANMGEPFISI